MYIFQTFNCGLKFDFSVFWEEKSLNFENIFTHLLVPSTLLTSLHDQDIIGSNLLLKINYKKLLTELRGFEFVTRLVLVFKKIESDDKTKYDTFYSHLKTETTDFSKHFNLRPFLLLRLSFWVTDASEVEFFFFEWSA